MGRLDVPGRLANQADHVAPRNQNAEDVRQGIPTDYDRSDLYRDWIDGGVGYGEQRRRPGNYLDVDIVGSEEIPDITRDAVFEFGKFGRVASFAQTGCLSFGKILVIATNV